MKKILYKIFPSQASRDVDFLTTKNIDKNRKVLQSLKDYDEGKKTISTTQIDRHLSNI